MTLVCSSSNMEPFCSSKTQSFGLTLQRGRAGELDSIDYELPGGRNSFSPWLVRASDGLAYYILALSPRGFGRARSMHHLMPLMLQVYVSWQYGTTMTHPRYL